MDQYKKSFLDALEIDNKRQLALNQQCLDLANKAYKEAKKVDEDNDKLLGQVGLNLPCNGAVGKTVAFSAVTQWRNESKDQLQKLTAKINQVPQATKPNADEIQRVRLAHLSGGSSSSSSVKEVRDQLECKPFSAAKEVLFAENKLLKIMFEDCKKLFKQAYEVLFNLTKENESMEFERLEMLNLAIYDAEKEPQVDLVTKYKRKTEFTAIS